MSLVSKILEAVGYRIGGGITIGTTTDPSTAKCLQWLNETAQWITGICAENDSDLGRTLGTITTLKATITGASKASPCSVTATSHGLMASGTAEVVIKSVSGMTELNDTEYTATYSSANAVTLGIDSSAYTTYTSGGYLSKRKFSDIATTLYAPAQRGWIVKSNSRDEIKLISESKLVDYDPIEAVEPSEFYVDGSNNICFPSYPDAVYTVKIPYWTLPTALTQTTDTIPFLGLMDNVFIEAVSLRYFAAKEYDATYELKWQQFLLSRVQNVIYLRKKTSSRVTT
ncbi:MAG TPA: phage adaptor protein [Candidatus Wunengus sp. YC61]|uniref:phage adaptor protein n=1 Tax=Candidatus Wunengus sp. YC61 TaxID=3367698 RepID=UPI0040278A83